MSAHQDLLISQRVHEIFDEWQSVARERQIQPERLIVVVIDLTRDSPTAIAFRYTPAEIAACRRRSSEAGVIPAFVTVMRSEHMALEVERWEGDYRQLAHDIRTIPRRGQVRVLISSEAEMNLISIDEVAEQSPAEMN